MRQSRLSAFVLTAALILIEAPRAWGATVSYDVFHTFSFMPTGGITSLPSYLFGVSATASPGGTDDVQNGSVVFGTSGGTSTHSASSTGLFSSATANSAATVDPFVIGGPVSGVIQSGGSIVVLPGGICCATSSANVVIEGGTSATHGSVGWGPEMSMGDPAACNCSANDFDPISFQVTDLTSGAVTAGTLFDVSSDLGVGSWTWGSGTFALNAMDFDFSIRMNSPFTVQQGTADLQVRNGIITTSDGTGMFAGIFPAVGTPGTFSIPFGSNFSIDYNLGSFSGHPVDVLFTLGDSGSACAVPEPATAALMGIAAALLLAGATRRTKTRAA